MTLMRIAPTPHAGARLLLAIFGFLGLTGCNAVTESTVSSTGPFYRITSDLKDASYPAGTVLSVPIHVTINGTATGATAVHWTLQSGHGGISDTLTTTDTLGATHILWTIGATPETNELRVVAGDAVDTLHITGVVGSPSYLDRVGALADTIGVGAPITLQVVVRDRPGNAAPGVTVNWSSSGGTLSTSTTVSDATGTVTEAFAAKEPGTYQVTADLPNRASLFFQIVVR